MLGLQPLDEVGSEISGFENLRMFEEREHERAERIDVADIERGRDRSVGWSTTSPRMWRA